MKRPFPASLLLPFSASMLLLGAACSASGGAADGGTPTQGEALVLPGLSLPAPASVSSTAPAATSSASDDAAFERSLREQLATGADPVPAALQLADWLAAQERLREALAVVDAGLARRPSTPDLRQARIELLRDLGRRHVAVAELRELLRQQGAAMPQQLLDLAELEWLEGHRDAAAAALRQLRQDHPGCELLLTRSDEIAAFDREVQLEAHPVQVRARDLLGNLRGAPEPAERLLSLQQLLGCGGEVAVRAVAAAVVDADPAVRALGVRAAHLDLPALLALVRQALQDDAPAVRAAAASRAAELPTDRAVPLLLGSLGAEHDAFAFLVMHQTLLRLMPDGPKLAQGGADSEPDRAATAAEWRRRCQ